MGIDARMCVLCTEKFSEEEVRTLSWEIGAAFGTEAFYYTYPQAEPPRPALSLIDRYEEFDSDQEMVPPRGGSLIRVELTERFWGIGYERGNLLQLLAIAKWLEVKTGGQVWYGGDSSGARGVLFDATEREKNWKHFLEKGNPYFERESFLKTSPPECPRFAPRASSAGGGGDRDFWICSGCGWRAGSTPSTGLKPLGWGLEPGVFMGGGKTAAEIIEERKAARSKQS